MPLMPSFYLYTLVLLNLMDLTGTCPQYAIKLRSIYYTIYSQECHESGHHYYIIYRNLYNYNIRSFGVELTINNWIILQTMYYICWFPYPTWKTSIGSKPNLIHQFLTCLLSLTLNKKLLTFAKIKLTYFHFFSIYSV